MERIGGEDIQPRASMKQVAPAKLAGVLTEWYDFFLYGTASALVFNQLFFPGFDPLVGTIASFATFGVGFVARPGGGIIFGHYGDKIGRKAMLYGALIVDKVFSGRRHGSIRRITPPDPTGGVKIQIKIA